jgi:hypothetical protein
VCRRKPLGKQPLLPIGGALAMIASAKLDAREDGAAILAEIGKGEGVVQSLLGALRA